MADFLILDDEKGNKTSSQKEKQDTGLMKQINDFIYSFQKVKVSEKAIFYRLMATMTNAGMGIAKSVQVLEKQEKNPIFKRILASISSQLSEWKSLSDAMESHDWDFAEAEIGMVSSWEKTGQLNKALSDLADQIERIEAISGKLKSAMTYPLFILLVVFWVVFILMTKVVPKLLDIFGDKSTLPESTQALIGVSDFLTNYWFLIVWAFILTYVFIFFWKKTPDGKYMFDNFLLKVPIFWKINQKLILSKFSRILSGLIGSGVSVVESIKITADAVWNEVYKQRLLLLREDVGSWIKIWESLDGDKLFPDMVVQLIQVGEQTAKLDETIEKVADFYDEQVDNTIASINKLLEPLIIIILAVVVWFIAVSIMEPIMNLSDTVSS